MGQYYRPIIEDNEEKTIIAIDNYIDGDYECAKLMEQSWFEVDYVNSVANKLFNNPSRIAWIGDYADNEFDNPKFKDVPVQELYELAWGKDSIQFKGLKNTGFNLHNKYLINHDTKEFLDLEKYFQKNKDKDFYVTNPVSLLTAIGNGNGGGDFASYHKNSKGEWVEDEEASENVGIWAWNILEISAVNPTKEFKEVEFTFVENN